MLESLFGLIVHDLRNPAATLAANLGFVREVVDDPTVPRSRRLIEALSDSQQALLDLMRGLDQLSWIGRWFNDHQPLPWRGQDLRTVLERAKKRIKYGASSSCRPTRSYGSRRRRPRAPDRAA